MNDHMHDLLDILLKHTRLQTKLFFKGQHCGYWQHPAMTESQAVFHLVLQGECSVRLKGESVSHTLKEGDLLFIARATEHIIESHDCEFVEAEVYQEFSFTGGLRQGATALACGVFEFEETACNHLLDALPHSVVVRADFHSDRNWMRNIIALLIAESDYDGLGSDILVSRLTDTLFVHIIRCYLASNTTKTGVFEAYADQALRKVLEAMYQAPEKSWRLGDFTTISNLSRSTFIERFTRILKQTPMAHLTQFRMEMAYRLLKEDNKKILVIALACGYNSEAAFCRAFKSAYNITPSEVRKS